MAYWNIVGGWGPQRDNAHAAMICANLHGSHGNRSHRALDPQTYTLGRKAPKPQMSDEDIMATFRRIAKR